MLRCIKDGFEDVIINISGDEKMARLGSVFSEFKSTFSNIIETEKGPVVSYIYSNNNHNPGNLPYNRKELLILTDFREVPDESIKFERNIYVKCRLLYRNQKVVEEAYKYFKKTLWRDDWDDYSEDTMEMIVWQINEFINEYGN